ncbi:MAG: hypothetical protein ACFFAU_13740 [Candidatus Hodarchaeota archaeon]
MSPRKFIAPITASAAFGTTVIFKGLWISIILSFGIRRSRCLTETIVPVFCVDLIPDIVFHLDLFHDAFKIIILYHFHVKNTILS